MEDPNILDCELSLLKGEPPRNLQALADVPFASSFFSGEYNVVVESGSFGRLLRALPDTPVEACDLIQKLAASIDNHLSDNSSEPYQLEILCVGIASLHGFLQENWTGPRYFPTSRDSGLVVPYLSKFVPCDIDPGSFFRSCLTIDGEETNISVKYPELLVLSKSIFSSSLSHLKSVKWWLLRSTYIHQQVLDEHSSSLQMLLSDLCNELSDTDWIKGDLKVLMHLELARIHLHYGKVNLSGEEISKAMEILKMEIGLKGALGKRTHFQQREIAQLTISVKVDRGDFNCAPEAPAALTDFPKDVLLDDDVRLPQVVFSNSSDGEQPDLTPLEQAAVIAAFVQKKRSNAKDRLMNEELMPYLNCLLAHPKVWAFHLSALLFRSRLESEHRRTIERSLLQTQALMSFDSNKTPLPLRLKYFYCSYMPLSFLIAADCASIFISIGSVQSALEIYLKLEMWEEVIACYNYLKLRHKAAEVIREQMKKGETVKLWCSLGDATDDIRCYERAWELSQHRSAQAQRHWGMYYFNRKQYKECISHFEQSLQINSLQVSLWFRLGYATLMEHRWEESAAAYRRYCALEPESFEAWNNLAKAYILLGQKQRAYTALQEAIKCNYETWQVWDNLMAVSSDCGDFEQVIFCYHRILDLKDKHIDEQILSVLTSVIIKGIRDCHGQPSYCHRKKALELFGRITSKVLGNPTIWELYADLTASIETPTPITRSKTVQYLHKAYTAALQDGTWCKQYDSVKHVLKLCQSLGEACLDSCKYCSTPREASHTLTSAKFSLMNVATKVKQQHTDFATGKVCSEIESEVDTLHRTLENIQTELSNFRSP